MAIRLTKEIIVLCEGKADQNFIKSLVKNRGGYPDFDYLEPTEEHSGNTGFGQMLKSIKGDRLGFSRLKGIIIVADSMNSPAQTFRDVCSQVSDVQGYPVPTAPSSVAPKTADHPAVVISLLPTDSLPGGLETLCVKELLGKTPWVEDCVNDFLRCKQIEAGSWPAEKLDKAKYHCIVAALNRDDPSKAVSYAFKGNRPVVDVMSPHFDDFARRLIQFCEAFI